MSSTPPEVFVTEHDTESEVEVDEGRHNDEDVLIHDDGEPPPERRQPLLDLIGRLRCLLGAMTCPILPLGTVVMIALIYFLLCSLYSLLYESYCIVYFYSVLTFWIAVYAPNHRRVRTAIFTEQSSSRRYDKIIHGIALFYVYIGILILQNAAADSCPILFKSLRIYVAALEIFVLVLFVPILVIPCVYLYFLRLATNDPAAMAMLRERFEEEDEMDVRRASTNDVLNQLETLSEYNSTKECCICMSDLDVESQRVIVKSKCGHVFHKDCIASWVNGRWGETNSERRARRTTCPLCRADLRSSSYGTFG